MLAYMQPEKAGCANLGKVAALIAMQREAGTPEKQLQEQAITMVSGDDLRALSMLIHTVSTDSVIRYTLPAKNRRSL
jgi:hypothetical protein